MTTTSSLRTAVLGVTGYSGAELVRLLLDHPSLQSHPPLLLGRASSESIALTSIHPQLSGLPHADELSVVPFDLKLLVEEMIDILFLATPHEQSREEVPALIAAGIRVIDLSGAWRLQHESNRAVYKLHDADPTVAAQLQAEAVYGSPELHAEQIKTARLVANPGCYATSILLALAPLIRANVLDLNHGIIADAKSGVSGAGKAPTATTHFMYAADNLSAYAVFGHRHTGELLEQLHLDASQIQFTPHLLPIPRGILSTIYVRLAQPGSIISIQSLYDEFYANAPLVRVRRSPALPQIQHVVRTAFCDLGFQLAPDGNRLVIISCLDNLLKGAASQAVENMNLMAGFPQSSGLR
ncbi:N-acetyl-gamma-glutamyl-phosphate reductase [Granulicella sp. 5B5]|uniref:N-acetyl-gamma-glutamyl-phosphate reductase n=1 Tax=Granulicella sp. 5B5 TaxID=1617967 RepID=UPI0015F6A9A8|nr:N-acetyl-gamma-glutamyl-phosphate reductase [Granulicella sp. 5B5]QMV17699.1 N-acetyl-gamma-glutamyl-phosphate reductase [Granulicella sp. 5B5]